MADRRKLTAGVLMMPESQRQDLARMGEEYKRFQEADYLRKMGEQGAGLAKSVARGVPQMATGLVDLAAMPFEYAGVLQPGQAVGSTKWLENKGYLPEQQEGFANQLTELLSGGFDPSDLVTKGLPALGMIGKTVWHGSPHIYDKFDMSKIGTGEGAQAYGHGLYLAESPGTARSYQESLSTGPERFLVNGEEVLRREAKGPMLDVSDPKTAAIVYAAREGDKGARKYFKTQGSWGEKAIAELDALKGQKITNELPGYLYKVDLPDEQIAKMLDWDKPLSEQPEVYSAIQKYAQETQGNPENAMRMLEGKTAGEAYQMWNQPQYVSQFLNEQGIPGIQYLDQASRGAGEGTRNYVVFSDEIPQILERNGQPVAQALRNYEAPQAQALREAEEYGQKMLGLPPGNTPMDRAIAGGFDPMYHGTASVIDEIDPRKYGGATRAQSAKEAFWGSGTVPTSEGYANYAAKEVPVRDLISQADEAGNVGDWDKADELIRQAEDLERDIYNQPLRGQNIMPMMVNTKNAKVVDLGGAEYTDVEGGINQYLKQGKREGKDVVVLENLSDDPGRSNMATTHYAVLNPGAVRSQFAAFDPRYFGKPGLMLGAGGLGVYGALQGEDEYQ